MCLGTVRKTIFRKITRYRPFAAVMLLTTSSLVCAQTSQPSVCNIDSDGFCVTGAVQAAPVSNPVSQNKVQTELSPAPQNERQVESIAPPNKLQVDFRDNLLRIDAENNTLQDTLKAVSARTGAEIQFPAGELGELIFVHLGPGSPRDVITQLLNGSQFNYVILSSASEPHGITRLILSSAGLARESVTSAAPALPKNDSAATQLYGAGFSADPDAPAEVVPGEKPAVIAPPDASPVSNLAQHNGPPLSGEDLDRMQKMQIQQEQQQFALQVQQQRQQQQQEQPSQNSPPQ
jgi:hypothetical protein